VSHSCSGINLQLRSSYVLEYFKKPKLYLKKKNTTENEVGGKFWWLWKEVMRHEKRLVETNEE